MSSNAAAPPLPQINSYPLPTRTPIIPHALDVLRPHHPVSIGLYRRLQISHVHENAFIFTNLDLSSSISQNEHPDTERDQDQEPFIIAFCNRATRPETEVWIYASWEGRSTSSAIAAPSSVSEQIQAIRTELVLALVRAIKALPLPDSIHEDVIAAARAQVEALSKATDDRDHSGLSRADYAAHMLDPSIVLCGAVHEATVAVLQRTGLAKQISAAGLVANHTYVFDIDNLPEKPQTLPQGLRWGELKPEHFALVRARTQIPRQDRTLAVLPNVAVYHHDGDREVPIAWVFVGLDGSLTTLHVEEEWRRKGLAKAITINLFREKMAFLWENGVRRRAHGFVISGNDASCRVCESLGGKNDWTSFWIRLDLKQLQGR